MNKYIMIGPPGAGKSTQANMLARAYGFIHISVGEMLWWNVKNRTKLGAKIERHVHAGESLPDQTLEEVVKLRLEQHDWNYGFVLDGYPANVSQAESLLESCSVDGVVQLRVPDEALAERRDSLRVCTACGFDFALIQERPRPGAVCASCGGELGSRSNENPKAVPASLAEYQNRAAPILDVFQEQELVVAVDGSQPIEDVHNYICAELGLTSEVMLELLRKKKR